MRKILLDTNLLVRLADPASVAHITTLIALMRLKQSGDTCCITVQNLVEFRAVATRPISANGLGLSSSAAELIALDFENDFTLLPDTPAIFPIWKDLVSWAAVLGKQVHDARLVAVAIAGNAEAILSFNTSHFTRICSFTTLQLLDPFAV